ncbi:MAG: hypothetical protein KAW56_07110 [Candidatus Marinimicrobia bacterium]|nr:hypothetical protein [Candidatus Neomarinimicrobiota bacterium]
MRGNFEKRDLILRNKENIIRAYDDKVTLSKIAKVYGVSVGCISNNLKLWGVRKRHGVKYLLNRIALQG